MADLVPIKATDPQWQDLFFPHMWHKVDLRNGKVAEVPEKVAKKLIREGKGGIINIHKQKHDEHKAQLDAKIAKKKEEKKAESKDVEPGEKAEDKIYKELPEDGFKAKDLPSKYPKLRAMANDYGYNGEKSWSRDACAKYLTGKMKL